MVLEDFGIDNYTVDFAALYDEYGYLADQYSYVVDEYSYLADEFEISYDLFADVMTYEEYEELTSLSAADIEQELAMQGVDVTSLGFDVENMTADELLVALEQADIDTSMLNTTVDFEALYAEYGYIVDDYLSLLEDTDDFFGDYESWDDYYMYFDNYTYFEDDYLDYLSTWEGF